MAQQVKNLLAMQETQEVRVQSLSGGDSPGGGNGIPLQYSCQENPMARPVWQATVHKVTKNQNITERLSSLTRYAR